MSVAVALTGLALALVAGPLGCFVVWRRMAYFGDGLAHSALLGVALGMLVGLSNQFGMIMVAVLFALSLIWLRARRVLATDTLLGILAHATLSFGIIAMTLLGAGDADLHDYLLGSIDLITAGQAVWLGGGAVAAFGLLLWLWPGLLLMTTGEELAHAEGVPIGLYEFLLMLLMGIVVATSVQIVGILLITSLLIIPASTARLLARSPEAMAAGGSFLAAVAILGGVGVAQSVGLATGPTIVALSVLIFLAVLMVRGLVK